MNDVTKIRLKIDTLNCFNNCINHINTLSQMIEDCECDVMIPFSAADISFGVMIGYLNDIASRAVELKDEKLIELCKGMHLINE